MSLYKRCSLDTLSNLAKIYKTLYDLFFFAFSWFPKQHNVIMWSMIEKVLLILLHMGLTASVEFYFKHPFT